MKHLAMAVVVKKDKVLVQKCYHADKGMMAQFPGGRVNFDESGTDAAIRELAQETGIRSFSYRYLYQRK
ncbi:NUDIX domain-containing protein [Vibrio taketomensis]|uniref:NUDIX domain-containing protein n=1 Tax=Vibrio taketomensis TaxID=2572923 RepID=UPI001E43840A|nr:NUDIX domain-containing protein [Vibrio taketomensis]